MEWFWHNHTVLCVLFSECEDEPKTMCCVCHEEPVNPVELPCSHIFCFLCIKGVAARSGACALCRKRIPSGYLDSPTVINSAALHSRLQTAGSEEYHWFYEGRNGGWWMYEDRASNEIEKEFINNTKSIKVQIAGFIYCIDFENMVQVRQDHPNRVRKIKRDMVSSAGVKGVAGIYLDGLKT